VTLYVVVAAAWVGVAVVCHCCLASLLAEEEEELVEARLEEVESHHFPVHSQRPDQQVGQEGEYNDDNGKEGLEEEQGDGQHSGQLMCSLF
jgi:hypothetical protein